MIHTKAVYFFIFMKDRQGQFPWKKRQHSMISPDKTEPKQSSSLKGITSFIFFSHFLIIVCTILSAGNILKDFIWISHCVANTLIKLQTNGSVNKLGNNLEKLLENNISTSLFDYIIYRWYREKLLVALEKGIEIIIISHDRDNVCFGFCFLFFKFH